LLSLNGILNANLASRDSLNLSVKCDQPEFVISGIVFSVSKPPPEGAQKLKVFNREVSLTPNQRQYQVPFSEAEILYYINVLKNTINLIFTTSDVGKAPL
jgi:hypothetical protein